MNYLNPKTGGVAALLLVVAILGARSCSTQKNLGRGAGSRTSTSARDTAEMLKADFERLNNLPDSFSLKLRPPSVLLDSRSSSNGKDVAVTIAPSAPDVPNSPWNQLEIVSGNADFRAIGVKPGDTIKCYLFPDGETRLRQRETGDVDPQMVTHEATNLIVAQVLSDRKLQIVGGVIPPRDLMVRIPEAEYAQQFQKSQADMDQLRSKGDIDSFGVRIPATQFQFAMNLLPIYQPSVAWPPRIEIWRVRDDRTKAMARSLGAYANKGEPPLNWQPSPDRENLDALVESFNRWMRSRKEFQSIEPPALLQTLPPRLLEDSLLEAFLSEEALNQQAFQPHEGRLLQESTWCRDIASWAAGDAFDPLPRARRLFDWVVRNVPLTESRRALNHRPWQTLVFGQGTPLQRAWVFAQLCRQQRIACCVLEIPQADEEQSPWLWCGIVDREKLHLFDPQLGLELPQGEGVATLSEVVSDDATLRALDLPDSPFPVTADLAKQATAYVVAGPMAMSNRAAILQEQQSGKSALRLFVDVQAEASRIAATPAVDVVKLWPYPMENLRRQLRLADASSAATQSARSIAAIEFRPFSWMPQLWKARMLHFRGSVETEQDARRKGILHDPINDHRAAAQLYLGNRVRPAKKTLERAVANQERLAIYRRSKVDATYWIALLKHDQGDYRLSLQWLENKVLGEPFASHRAIGVRYNRARAYEALGQTEQAIELLEQDESPQRHGNRLRAARLKQAAAATNAPAAEDQE